MSGDALFQAALSLTVGTSVDWASHESSVAAEDRPFLLRLRQLEALARLHGSDGSPENSPHDSIRAGDHTATNTPVRWGPLEILEKVGHGSYGDVYRARDVRLGRYVALKLLRHRDVTSAEDSLIREGHLLSRVRHPNVVTVYGAERIDQRVGVWMEFVGGATLEQELQRRGPLPPREIAEIGIQLAGALGAVHEADLLHRDIKTQNIMRDASGRLVLMDFGAGHDAQQIGAREELAGTPAYLAPEILAGRAPSRSTDLFALGVVLFRLATGRFQSEASGLASVHGTHARGDRHRLRSLRPELSRDLADVIERAIAVDAATRPRNAADLADALRAAAHAPARRRMRLAVGVFAAAALAVTALWTSDAGRWTAERGGPPAVRQDPPLAAAAASAPRPPGDAGGRAQAPQEIASTSVAGPRGNSPDPADDRTANAAPPAAALTSLHENLRHAAVIRSASADPRLVTCTPWGAMAVAICDLVTGTIRVVRMPTDLSVERSPAAYLSPDGGSIAYLWLTGAMQAPTPSIRITKVDGSRDRELYRRTDPSGSISLFGWAPSGRSVLVHVAADGKSDVLLLPEDGRAPTSLRQSSSSHQPSWADLSPDGRFLLTVFPRRDGLSDDAPAIRLLDVAGGKERQILGPSWDPYAPRWTPKGDAVVFASNRLGVHGLFLQEMSGGEPIGEPALIREFNRNPIFVSGFSSDGALLVTVRVAHWDVFRAPVDLTRGTLGPSVRIDPRSIDESQSAEWTVDGQRLAYIAGVIGSTGKATRIVIRHRQGSVDRELPFPGTYSNQAVLRWSPDGRRLGIVSVGSDSRRMLHVVDVDTGSARVLTSAVGSTPDFKWGDVDHVYQVAPRGLAVIDVRTDTVEQVYQADKGWRVTRVAAAPDAQSFAVLEEDRETGVACAVRIVARDGAVRDRHRFTATWCEAIAWSGDGSRVIVAASDAVPLPRPRPSSLWIMDPVDGDPVRIRVHGEPIVQLSLSPDDRELLFTAGNPRPEYLRFSGFLGQKR